VELAELTTLRLGGPARRMVEARTEAELVAAVREAEPPVLVLAGGSNVVIADDGVPGTVVRVATRGIERDGERLTVAAGEPWDDVVALCVGAGLQGFECLSGIPGSTGATPIQNVGAYGQEVAETVETVRVLDRETDRVEDMPAAACGFRYRASVFKYNDRRVVLSVTFRLRRDGRSGPLRYTELARTLDVPVGATAPLTDVREAVLALRRGKGMVIDPADPDSVSAGSFFTNPILEPDAFAALAARLGPDLRPPAWPEGDGRIKTSAAWLIERAGFHRGHGNGRVGISTKHTLALVNRGGATTTELMTLAHEIAAGVHERFGIHLAPEPVLVGHEWRARSR
jgi:UDP-N-acetylmuramate dehydrogenase